MKLLWLDVETTGLDPVNDVILEVAAVVADLERPFDTRDAFEVVLHDDASFAEVDPFVVDMHTKNGLWQACRESRETLEDAEERLIQMTGRVVSREDITVLAGSSVHFDLAFLRQHMPRLAKFLSHRVYDVSAVKLFCQSMGMVKPPRAEAHRAMADVRESIEHARQCAEWIVRMTNVERKEVFDLTRGT